MLLHKPHHTPETHRGQHNTEGQVECNKRMRSGRDTLLLFSCATSAIASSDRLMRLLAAALVVVLLRNSAPQPPPGSETAAIPDRAAEAFVAALQLYARQPASVAQSALRTFARKQEPLPYLPEFVLMDFSSQGAHDVHRVVAHMGAGQATVHPYFLGDQWREIRVDISAANRPDIVADMVSVREHLADASVDAVYSAHSLEHLPPAEAARAQSLLAHPQTWRSLAGHSARHAGRPLPAPERRRRGSRVSPIRRRIKARHPDRSLVR